MGSSAVPVLVTGVAGWVGLALAKALASGLEGIFDGPPFGEAPLKGLLGPGDGDSQVGKLAPNMRLSRGDVTAPETLGAFFDGAAGGTLFHCAGLIHPKKVKQFFEVNTVGTQNIWEAARAATIKRVVIISSNSPCGNNPHPDHLFDERSPYEPYMGYGRSKMLMEKKIAQLSTRGGPETVIIRPPWFYGPFQPPRQTEFFLMIRDGRGPLVGPGHNRRSMTYIDNLVQGLLLGATRSEAAGKTYWIADRRPYPMTEIIDTVERVLEKDFGLKCRHKRLRLPSVAADMAGLMDWGLQALGMYQQKIHVLSEMNKTIACSVALAESELGYRPQVELEEGMRRSVAWLMEQPGEKEKLVGKGKGF
ncbi:MAG: NAD(P)-dependent oxidoreductase [Deltaproteobacteria bacterium]|jgi:nucleoside-diphosphate-sugar epimerase|nr:NAD(P)-dependent oxidoreductase [Deltaproteobacteria bacterium]